ncbi:Type II secretion system (T2SS)-associated protein Gcp14 [Andalucia godoyi]|uniref:Type II secretion system (T2SS)-associated protein Gcp14 n=1 Tax=Andalucia godoyi TaxID=505711 RepID=A0A8K0AGW4_ANDGO|nr:Type II secretion system (T2SS)-associated protein Gcp14 [Andalucia godoyi]|eukprot:ANDGO_07998.mRNA.1 Type II secretion system (T2SS)-associated protein Gcp14
MSSALRPSGSPSDLPRLLFRLSVAGWFVFRLGEKVLYFALKRLRIPHTPKWTYDPSRKYVDNMDEYKAWKRSPLFRPAITGPGSTALLSNSR